MRWLSKIVAALVGAVMDRVKADTGADLCPVCLREQDDHHWQCKHGPIAGLRRGGAS